MKKEHSPSSTVTRFSETLRESTQVLETPALTILCHPDGRRVGERAPLLTPNAGETAAISRREPLFGHPGTAHPGMHSGLRGLDVSYVSRMPLRLGWLETGEAARADLVLERRGSSTPVEVDGRPLGESHRFTGADLRRGAVLELGGRVVLLLNYCPIVSDTAPRFGLVGESAAIERLRGEIAMAAAADMPVLLRGASGTGKELVARAVHDAGARRRAPWVAVNMAAIPPSLAAAELFGSRKGAFTGADRSRDGYFLAADGGTLFLDEIADTPAEVQPLLLRALESGEIQPVGSAESRRVDVRVIAATDADLESRIAGGSFRTPLLHRLAGFDIHLPTLAERRDDIGRLLVHYLERELGGLGPLLAAADAASEKPWPPAPLVARLAAYDWPGNVRQLVNVARRLALMQKLDRPPETGAWVESLLADDAAAGESPRGAKDIPANGGKPTVPAATPSASPTGRWRPVYRKASEVEEDELVAALRAASYELTPAAKALGVSRAALYQLIEKCPRVRKAADLEREEIEEALVAENDEAAVARALEVSLQGLRLRMKALGLR